MKEIKITTIDEEFEKAQVKGHIRTRRGKMERVKPFERRHQSHMNFYKPSEGGPDIRHSDIRAANKNFQRQGLQAKAALGSSIYVGHHLVTLDAASKGDLKRATKILKEHGIDL